MGAPYHINDNLMLRHIVQMMVHAEIVITVAGNYKPLAVCVESYSMLLALSKSSLVLLRMIHLHSHRAVLVICCVAWERRIRKRITIKGRMGWHAVCHILLLYFSYELSRSYATASLEASSSHILPVSLLLWSTPQRSLHSIIRVSAMSIHTGPPGRVMYCRLDQIKHRHLKMWT